jgi:hypothetical protein
LLQPLQERHHAGLIFGVVGGAGYEHGDAPHPLALLRARGERQRYRGTEKRDELAPLHAPNGKRLVQGLEPNTLRPGGE